jgi:hypothetical protein
VAAVKVFHDHSVRDIDAIGKRNIGCGRGFGNWYTLERQIAMGKGLAAQVESTSKLITDPEVTEYINRIGQNLVRNSDSLVPFTIKVVESDDINAFALPGGFFYVDSGLIQAADSEAELAGVMATKSPTSPPARGSTEHPRAVDEPGFHSDDDDWWTYRLPIRSPDFGRPLTFLEVFSQLRIRGRFPRCPVHVQSRIRSHGLHFILRKS